MTITEITVCTDFGDESAGISPEYVHITFAYQQTFDTIQEMANLVITEMNNVDTEIINSGVLHIAGDEWNIHQSESEPIKKNFPYSDISYWLFQL